MESSSSVTISARETAPNKTDERGSVTYRTEDHIAILFQMYGSVWRRVFPYCIVNIIIAFLVAYTEDILNTDMSFHDQGHTFMSIMVSFLVVTRGHIANQRYMESRKLLSDLMKSCRELVQHTVAFTRYEHGQKAKMWRADISRRTCSLLRTVVSVLEYDTKGEHVWQVSELTKSEKQALILSVGGSNERSPMVLSIFLRTSIASHVENLEEPLDVNKELKLLNCTTDFVTAYHGLMKLMTTPFPFPLVQMTRTFLFVWVYSLPFALSSDIGEIVPLMFVVFFVTYGFIGLEFVAMELDEPFGNDANGFDAMGLAKVVFDDICITIKDIDGNESASKLEKIIDCPLRAQIESDVRNHERYTKLDTWKSGRNSFDDDNRLPQIPLSPTTSTIQSLFNTSSYNYGSPMNTQGLEIPSTINESSRSSSGNDLELTLAKPSTISKNERSISFGTQERNVRSGLFESLKRRKDSEDSIEVFGTNESVKYDYMKNSITVKRRAVSRGSVDNNTSSEEDRPLFDPNRHRPPRLDIIGTPEQNSWATGPLEIQRRKVTDDSSLGHSGTDDSARSSSRRRRNTKQRSSRRRANNTNYDERERLLLDPNRRPPPPILDRPPAPQNAPHKRSHKRNISFNTQEKNVRSGLLDSMRRKDSDDSIEVFGTNESVKFDSKRNSITVKQIQRENVDKTAESELDQILFDPNQQQPTVTSKKPRAGHRRSHHHPRRGHQRNVSFNTQEKNVQSSLLEALQKQNSDSSIEVFGTGESVRHDSRSNRISARQKNDGSGDNVDSSEMDRLL